MSLRSAIRFLQHVDLDSKIQARADAMAWDSRQMVRLASHEGYRVTEHELLMAMDELWGDGVEAAPAYRPEM